MAHNGIIAEKHLLVACRDKIRALGELRQEEVQVEHDEIAAATIAHKYVAVMPGGIKPGFRHPTSGGIWDLTYGADVTVIKRVAEVPRDRVRDAYLSHLGSLDDLITLVLEAIDFQYDVMNSANAALQAEFGPTTQGFMHPLVFAGMEKRPRIVDGAMFNAPAQKQTNQIVGLGRTIYFTSARRIVSR